MQRAVTAEKSLAATNHLELHFPEDLRQLIRRWRRIERLDLLHSHRELDYLLKLLEPSVLPSCGMRKNENQTTPNFLEFVVFSIAKKM